MTKGVFNQDALNAFVWDVRPDLNGVAMTYGHKTGHTVDPRRELFWVLPHDLDPILGIYVAQMGPDQEGGIRFLAEEVLPLLNSGT